MTFQRPVSPNEWLYLAGARLAPPFAIQLVVEGRGRIDPDLLRAAVAAADCPGARLVRRGRIWVDSRASPPVRVIESVTDLRRPLAATCEVLLAADSSALVFRAFHGVMDGRGALTWATEVFRVLRGERPLGAASAVTDYALLDRLGAVGRRRVLALASRSPLGSAPRSGGVGWRRRTLDGNYPGLVARLAAALASGHRSARFMIPVDLRRHAPELASTANLSLPIFLDGRAEEPWTAWQQRLLAALSERRELTSGTSERGALRMPLRPLGALLAAADLASKRAGRYACTALLSHVGRIDLAAISTDAFTATTLYSLPVHAPFAPVSFVATEPAGRTELTMSYPDGAGMAEHADALLDRVCEAISPTAHRGWASGPRSGPAIQTTVVELFHRQVEATPDAVALVDADETVTYAELDRRADVVAAVLADRGVGPGAVVGLLADRSVPALVGLWGVLKAGAAYLPLDPQHPDRRIAALLADADAPVCLAGRRHADRVPDAVVLEDLPASGAPRAVPGPRPDDLAYVLYTSGSTGRPKGVQIAHRSLVSYVTWATTLYQVDADTRFALFTSLAFDLTGTAIFPPLLAGGSVALVRDEVSPATLRHVVTGSGANALKLTPAHLDLISTLELAATGFRTLVVGGEQLTGAIASRAQRAFGPHCRIVNEYGPTEATIGCVVHVFNPVRDGSAAAVPIGRPVGNTKIVLHDAHRRPVAPGEAGELYLAGDQLARGYLGRPDLDREAFVQLADGSRAYRTGDLARLLPTGALECLGRADDQIKIRGHRVEPGEVEAALLAYPGVTQAAVVARVRPGSRETVLCAYVTGTASVDHLRRDLGDRLPRYLVPSFVTVVDALPHTPNGKVDVRALPDPFPAGGSYFVAERDPVEDTVARIWSRILAVDVEQIGPDADFHSLGGDSLSMIEMIVAVGRTVVGPAGEQAFQDEAATLVGEPTLARVCAAARRAALTPTPTP